MLPSRDTRGFYERMAKFLNGIWGMGRVYIAASIILAISVCALVISQFVFWTISVDGRSLVLVENRSIAKRAVELLLKEEAVLYNCNVYIRQSVEISPVLGAFHGFSSPVEDAAESLKENVQLMTGGVAVLINSEDKLYLRDEKDARQSLGAIKDRYRPQGALGVEFEENVELVKKSFPIEDLVDMDNAVKILSSGIQKVSVHKVEEGDTLWGIARKEGVGIETLMELNQGVNPNFLQIGQKIKLNKKQPVLNVVSSYETVEMEEMPYSVIEAGKDPNLEFGEVKIVQQGVPGRMDITYRVVEKNGKEVEKYPVKKVVKQHPRPQIVITGSEIIMASRSGRATYRPVQGTISSNYGMRYNGMHNGIDFAAANGSPVVAMTSGTVKYAGSRGGYGLAVDIDHGNGILTRYAHLSDLVVSRGQRINGGQLIGRVGATGNATGPHLHFEVRVNKQPRDPGNFI